MARRLQLVVFLLVYSAGLLGLPARAFWLDELIHLAVSRDHTFEEIPTYAALNAGQVPLAYMYQRASFDVFGYSETAARLPSVLFSAGACAAIFLLASRLGLGYPMLPVLLFALFPLQLRYALEVRPYSAVLCFAAWATVAFLWLLERPGVARAACYFLLLAAGLYTLPYTLFVPAAHFLWLMFVWKRYGLRVVVLAGSASALGVLLFVPWLRFAASQWSAEIATLSARGGFGLREVQLIAKEMVGLGYLGTLLVAVPAVLGWRTLDRERRVFWALLVAVPMVGAICGNLVFGYFFASRQFIAVLVPLAILAAVGIERFSRARWMAGAWAAVLIAASMYENAHALRRPREDWGAAAAALRRGVSDGGACVYLAPGRSFFLYRYYDAEFAKLLCDPAVEATGKIALALSPYESAVEYKAATERLAAEGWKAVREESFQGPKIIWFSKAP